MEESLRAQLVQLSADFYRAHATSFEESRQNAWDSWGQVLALTQGAANVHQVLDLGCGNGRFANFLDKSELTEVTYCGVDTEVHFISKAQERFPHHSFRQQSLESALEGEHLYDLIVSFGVFHHLPGAQYRQQVLRKAAKNLAANGVIALSLWQPHLLKNFANKAYADHGVDGLEPHDLLLGWNGDFGNLRYCHDFTDAEVDELVKSSELELLSQFQGDGNDLSNRYVILRQT